MQGQFNAGRTAFTTDSTGAMRHRKPKNKIKQQKRKNLGLSLLHAQSLSCVQVFTTLWTVDNQAPLSMGFSRQEYWSGLPFPYPRGLPTQGVNTGLLHWQSDSLPLSHQRCSYKKLYQNESQTKYIIQN